MGPIIKKISENIKIATFKFIQFYIKIEISDV